MTQRDRAWTKAWRCDSAWLVRGCQVTLGGWGAAGTEGTLGEGLACQAKGSLGFLQSCAGTRHPLGSAVMQREGRGAHTGGAHTGRKAGGCQAQRKPGKLPALEPELRQWWACASQGCCPSVRALEPGSAVFPRAPFLCRSLSASSVPAPLRTIFPLILPATCKVSITPIS